LLVVRAYAAAPLDLHTLRDGQCARGEADAVLDGVTGAAFGEDVLVDRQGAVHPAACQSGREVDDAGLAGRDRALDDDLLRRRDRAAGFGAEVTTAKRSGEIDVGGHREALAGDHVDGAAGTPGPAAARDDQALKDDVAVRGLDHERIERAAVDGDGAALAVERRSGAGADRHAGAQEFDVAEGGDVDFTAVTAELVRRATEQA
jgi:hypothetical protein